MLRQKIQVAYLLIAFAFNLVYFTSQYDLTRLNHRFDSKQLVTTTSHTKKIEDLTFDELSKLELKLEHTTFSQKDMNKLFQLMKNVVDMGKKVNTPHVYWYSRQGRQANNAAS
jgi:hypothetical protein